MPRCQLLVIDRFTREPVSPRLKLPRVNKVAPQVLLAAPQHPQIGVELDVVVKVEALAAFGAHLQHPGGAELGGFGDGLVGADGGGCGGVEGAAGGGGGGLLLEARRL